MTGKTHFPVTFPNSQERRRLQMSGISSLGGCRMFGMYALSLAAICLWGMSYLWSDTVLGMGIPVEYLVFVRILVAALALLAINIILGKDIRLQRGDLKLFLLLALFEPLIYFVCESYGIKLTESPTYSSLMIATGPIFSVIVGMLVFKEKFGIVNMLGIAVCLGGIVMVTLCSSTIGKAFWLGMILLIMAVLSEVGHASITKVLSERYAPSVIVMYQFLFGTIYLLPLFLRFGLEDFNPDTYLSWDVWKPIICLAVLCSSLAFSLWAYTIKCLGVAKSSIFMSTIPLFTAICGWILGQEILSVTQWAGIFVACIGVVISQITFRKRKSLAEDEPSSAVSDKQTATLDR